MTGMHRFQLDDYIIDEILSLEDEQQQLRSTLNCNGTAADERDTQVKLGMGSVRLTSRHFADSIIAD